MYADVIMIIRILQRNMAGVSFWLCSVRSITINWLPVGGGMMKVTSVFNVSQINFLDGLDSDVDQNNDLKKVTDRIMVPVLCNVGVSVEYCEQPLVLEDPHYKSICV